MRSKLVILLILSSAGFSACQESPSPSYANRWVRVETDLSSDSEVERLGRIIQIAADHELTGLMFAAGLDAISLKPPEYFRRLEAVRRLAEDRGLEIIPSFLTLAYTGDLLNHDRNLAEGLPVRDALFVAKGEEAIVQPDPPVNIVNGGFEAVEGEQAASFQPSPGWVSLAIDSQIAFEGERSLGFASAEPLRVDWAGITQTIAVQPYRQYRLSAWFTSEDFKGIYDSGSFQIDVLGGTDKRPLHYEWPDIPVTGEWQKFSVGFNSWGYDEVDVIPKFRRGTTGKFWLDDLRIEEVGLINVVRRPGAPVTVKSERTGLLYEENRDFAPISDPILSFRYDHEGPPIRILPNSRIQEGERLRVSYYHGVIFYNGTTPVCMSEPKLWEIWNEQVRLVHQYLAPGKYHLHMDDARTGGSCAACKSQGLSLPEMMGGCITRQFQLIRSFNPNAEVYMWGDVLDPNHDANPDEEYYFLADGNYAGTYKFVPRELKVTCWGYSTRFLSLSHFSSLGFQTMAAAYYDADDLENVNGWLEALDQTPGAIGIIYTSWQDKYDLLPDFGRLLAERR